MGRQGAKVAEKDHVVIGRIVKPHGIRGEVKVYPLTDVPDRFEQLEEVWLNLPGTGLTGMVVEGCRYQGEMVILALENVETRDQAAALAGLELFIPSEDSPALPEGVYYWHQIIGMEVRTDLGRILGTIVEIMETGSNDVYVVKDGPREYLVPAIPHVIGEVDVHGKRMTIHPIPGMLDED